MEFLPYDLLKNLDEPGEIIVIEHLTAGQVEVHFIDGSSFDYRREFKDPLVEFVGVLRIVTKSAPDNCEVGAETERRTCGHSRANAECASFVRRRGNNATTRRRASNDDRFTDEGGILDPFDRDIETIKIQVGDIAIRGMHGVKQQSVTNGG
jgi:hypothetical protein